MNVGRRLGLATCGVIAMSVFVATAHAIAPLSRLVLRGAQVGPGYVLKLRPDSHGVANTVTLDMCGTTFQSEAERTARLQVNYVKKGSPLQIANEVVTYRPGGTALAMREIRNSVAHCPPGPVRSAIAGVGPLVYRIKPLTGGRGLLPGSIALLLHVTGTSSGNHVDVTIAAVYQARANVLSGIYGNGLPLAAQEKLVLHAAAASAVDLRKG